MNPLRRPRRWIRVLGAALILVAAWWLLVPITAVYVTSDADPAPREVSTLYSWWTSEQDLIFSDARGTDLAHLDPNAYLDQGRLREGYRLNCGNTFTSGDHEDLPKAAGRQACSQVETPRRIVGLILLGLGVMAGLVAQKLPGDPDRDRYRQPRIQRRLLK